MAPGPAAAPADRPPAPGPDLTFSQTPEIVNDAYAYEDEAIPAWMPTRAPALPTPAVPWSPRPRPPSPSQPVSACPNRPAAVLRAGPLWRSACYKSKQFDTACATLGVQRILATAYDPEGKGKIERFFGFVRSDFLPELETSDVTSLHQLNQSLLAWLESLP